MVSEVEKFAITLPPELSIALKPNRFSGAISLRERVILFLGDQYGFTVRKK
ncbi:MAG: hypothetical protein L7S53_03625 [Luminiphilus sp.]|nr:hypothetical protein [Luminiphilus sp.]